MATPRIGPGGGWDGGDDPIGQPPVLLPIVQHVRRVKRTMLIDGAWLTVIVTVGFLSIATIHPERTEISHGRKVEIVAILGFRG